MSASRNRIYVWRREAGLSGAELARRAGLHHKVLQRIEDGADPRVSTVARLIEGSRGVPGLRPLAFEDFFLVADPEYRRKLRRAA